jgi:hypoxanthine phosphoribosyltransferase
MASDPLDRLNLLIDENHIHKSVKEMARRIDEDFVAKDSPNSEPIMVVVLKGGFIFAADLLTCMNRPIPVIFVTPRLPDWEALMSREDRELIKGRDLIVVDLLLDSGISQKRLCQSLAVYNPASIRLAIMLHKTVEQTEDLTIDYLGFEVPDVRLVGYGLDENQRFRGLAGVYTWWTAEANRNK